MVRKLINKLKPADHLLILFLAALILFEARSWALPWFPREIREADQLAAAADLAKGINIYSPEVIRGEEFPAFIMYGFLSPLLIAALSLLTGGSVLVSGTVFYLFCKLGACFLLGLTVYRKKQNLTIALLCAALLYPCFWRYEVFGGIFPDALGIFLSVLFYYVTETGILRGKNHPFQMAGIILLLFYTKYYFVFILFGAGLYLLLHNRKDFFRFSLFGSAAGICSILLVDRIFPLFFTSTIPVLSVSTRTSVWNSVKQLLALGRYFPLPILILLVWFFAGLYRLYRKKKEARTFFSFPMLETLCIFPFAFLFGRNDGTWLTYYLQMLMPAAILLFGEVFGELATGENRIAAAWKKPALQLLLLIAFLLPTCKYSLNLYLTPEMEADWNNLYARLDVLAEDKEGALLLGPELGFYAIEKELYLLDEGAGQYINDAFLKSWEESALSRALFPHAPELCKAYRAQTEKINRDIREGRYAYVVIDENWTEYFVDLEALQQTYERIERHGLQVGPFGVSVDIYRRR